MASMRHGGDSSGMKFWAHYCIVDRCITETAEGEECSWCGERQQFVCDDPNDN